MTPHRRTLVSLITLLATLIAGTAVPATLRSADTDATTSLTSTPAEIITSVALGNTKQITISLQNTGGTTLTPRLYEALPSSATASLTQAVPADLAAVSLPSQAQRVDPQISAATAADPDAPTDMLVFLGDQADLSAAYAISDWTLRGQYVYATLRDHAARTQAGLRALLDSRGVSYTPLWIVNALAVRGDAADLAALTARPEVALLRANRLLAFDAAPIADTTLDQTVNCQPNASNVCWNLVRIGADRVWDSFGVRGAGITVASIDSGVTYTHPALVSQYRGNTGSGFSHSYNWFDAYGSSAYPIDSGNHGTHTMGTMVASGGASASTPAVGVAPGARWITARACGASNCSEAALIQAAQWLLAPTDLNNQNPRSDLRPQIINNSWSSDGGNSWYAGYVAAWRAAGIFPVFAAGNDGHTSGCSTVNSPGDYAQVVGVGALDSANQIASYSSVGPSPDGRLKPDISAPGSAIVSTISNLSYASINGTSMATPHVAGSVALLWSANPSLIGDYDRTYQILTQSAVPISGDTRFDSSLYSLCHATSTPNNIYGYGRIDAYAATAAASVDVPWLSLPAEGVGTLAAAGSTSFEVGIDAKRVPGPGTYHARIIVHSADLSLTPLIIPVTVTVPTDPSYATVSGHLTRAVDGSPLVGTVSVSGGATASTDASGTYQIVLPPSAIGYTLTARSFDYAPQSVTLTLGTGEIRSHNFALDSATPQLVSDTRLLIDSVSLGQPKSLTFMLRNDGTKALDYTVEVPAAQYGVWRSEQADGPTAAWIDPPANATTISLADEGISSPIPLGFAFPFFDLSYTTVSISANGVLSFTPLSSFGTYTDNCLPLSETPGAALVPLHIDLNPGLAGRVSYARMADGFLVSWEDVPLFRASSQRLSFQALLRQDGRATLNYKQVDGLRPDDLASVGVQQRSTSAQSLGCGGSLSLSNGQTIDLRPQPSTALWAALPNSSGTIPPGGQVDLPMQLAWARNPWPWPASADVLIQSNDPAHPTTTLTARMTMIAAPHTILLPIIFR